MTTIIIMFFIAFAASLAITPLVEKLAFVLELVDIPSARKVHEKPIPRIGGLAIYLSFFFSFTPLLFPGIVARTRVLELVIYEPRIIYIVMGSCVAFGLGLYDDKRGLSPFVKFGIQGIAALIAFAGGVRIESIGLPGLGALSFGWLSLPVTVFWILLVVNAINLIDGLDGLAAGVSFFVCMVLLVLCVLDDRILVAVMLAALAGSTLGFLRYNFNPARIFMGDGGSYFLGYMLSTLSILGSMKGQTAIAILIPVIALGVPLTCLAPLMTSGFRFSETSQLSSSADARRIIFCFLFAAMTYI
jgi:UDP-GlcNAc:undecaprenyl-phosphate/decaprenyl-phosphate GlcNAc-1-phosphate transferase